MTSTVVYNGDIRATCTHLQSGTVILTDGPTDNHGKGAAFSPTDLVCTALAACAISLMGIYAKTHDLNVDGASAEVTKIMQPAPRKIAKVIVNITMPPNNFSEKDRGILEKVAWTCPVSLSLNPDVIQEINFNWL
jgi:uncharacterized OsmC-like protein